MEAISSSTESRPGPGRPTRKASAARREYMLRVGSRIICEQGYHGTSIRDIVQAVGVPKGSFYNYFDSKEDFVVEALNHHMSRRLAEFSDVLKSSAASPRERIVNSFRMNPDRIASDDFTPMSFLTKVTTEVGNSSAKIDQASRNLFAGFRELLVASLREAQATGEISSEKDPENLATFVLLSWHGAMMYSRDREAHPHRDPFFEVLERDILV